MIGPGASAKILLIVSARCASVVDPPDETLICSVMDSPSQLIRGSAAYQGGTPHYLSVSAVRGDGAAADSRPGFLISWGLPFEQFFQIGVLGGLGFGADPFGGTVRGDLTGTVSLGTPAGLTQPGCRDEIHDGVVCLD